MSAQHRQREHHGQTATPVPTNQGYSFILCTVLLLCGDVHLCPRPTDAWQMEDIDSWKSAVPHGPAARPETCLHHSLPARLQSNNKMTSTISKPHDIGQKLINTGPTIMTNVPWTTTNSGIFKQQRTIFKSTCHQKGSFMDI